MDESNLPRHVAIIMDGNGRWAERRGLSRIKGHEAGIEAVRAATEECARLKIAQLTLYAFSSENWKRPRYEVTTLMAHLRRFLIEERHRIMENNIRLTTIGQVARLPAKVRAELERTCDESASNTGLNVCLALSYGGRQEIVDACKAIAEKVAAGELAPEEIDETTVVAHLYQPEMPEPDLVIRTAGEQRISNFLLWQISYSELYVTETLWPDFREADLREAFEAYAQRERRFGGLSDARAAKRKAVKS